MPSNILSAFINIMKHSNVIGIAKLPKYISSLRKEKLRSLTINELSKNKVKKIIRLYRNNLMEIFKSYLSSKKPTANNAEEDIKKIMISKLLFKLNL